MQGGITSYELLTRWMQLGSFLPWYRNHYDGYTKGFQEPYRYGAPVPANCQFYVNLRYQMIDIYYSAMWQASQSGLPIVRPLFLNDPADLQAYANTDTQFFVGDDFLVAPIVTQHDTASPPTPPVRSVYLPAGSEWYAFVNNTQPLGAPVTGGTLIENWYAPLTGPAMYQVPMYVRAGAILPMRDAGQQYIDASQAVPITFNVYPGPDRSFELYLDDGVSANPAPHRLTEISHTAVDGGQQVRVQRLADDYTPPEPFFYVSILGVGMPSSVTAAGAALPDVDTPEALASSTANAWYYNSSIRQAFLKIFDTSPDITMQVLS